MITKLIILTLIALVSAVIDTIAGGGGLITVPALLIFGMPPLVTLATNKFQATFGSGTATWHFAHKGTFCWREIIWGMAWCFIGAVIGTLVIQRVHPNFIRHLIPVLLLGVWLYMFFSPNFGFSQGKKHLKESIFFFIFGLLLGFYDGILGPGTGSFWVFFIIALLGWNLKKATMHTKLYNFVSNLASLIVFMFSGLVNYEIGLCMAVGQIVGGYIGSHLVISKGSRLIRPLLLTMTGLMILVLCYKQWA